jgi:hypothetical protein
MATWHFFCRRCKNDFYCAEARVVVCPRGHCRSRSITTQGYSTLSDARVLLLAERIEELEVKVREILEESFDVVIKN